MKLGFLGDGSTFEHLLDQINAPTRAIEFVAENLVGRTGGGAKTAVHAGPQDRLGLVAFAGALDEIGQVSLHGSVHSPWIENTGRVE